MKCLDCGNEMNKGIIEGYGQGGSSCYEFTSDEEKKKRGLKGFFTRKTVTVSASNFEHPAWYCPKCKKVLMWMDTDD